MPFLGVYAGNTPKKNIQPIQLTTSHPTDLQRSEHDAQFAAFQARLHKILDKIQLGTELQNPRPHNDVQENREQIVHIPDVTVPQLSPRDGRHLLDGVSYHR